MTKVIDDTLHIAGGLFARKHADGIKFYTTKEQTPLGRETGCWGLSMLEIDDLMSFLLATITELEVEAGLVDPEALEEIVTPATPLENEGVTPEQSVEAAATPVTPVTPKKTSKAKKSK